MQKQIIPSIIAKNQKEFDERFEKVKSSSQIHLDVMDGSFVEQQSLNFPLTLPKKKYHLHMMVKNPKIYIKWISKYATTVIFHIEACKNKKELLDTINLIKEKNKKVGLAINPKSKIQTIWPFIKLIDLILIMTVNPGRYGARFLSSTLKKAKEIKKNSKIKIALDGGINDKTIKLSKKNADIFITGSYIQNSKNPNQAIRKLKQLANNLIS